MLADWIGAGKAQGAAGVHFWWDKNKDRIMLGPITREWIEQEIDSLDTSGEAQYSPLE